MGQEEWAYTPNEIVSYNLQRARKRKGWTQEQAAEQLEPFLGVRWSGSAFSVAERWHPKPGQKVRQFGAEEIAAFAAVFEVSIDYFFQPPPNAAIVRFPGSRALEAEGDYRKLLVALQAERQELTELEERARDLLAGMQALGIDPSTLLRSPEQAASEQAQASVEEARRARHAALHLDQPAERSE